MLQSLLAEGRPLLADGATGTNLFAMGLTSGDSPELWNAERADRIESLHRSFVDAGSDIILTNSFGANRRRLMLHKLEGRTRELNRLAAEIARKVADSAGRRVVVAGSVGPTGDLLAPLGPLSEDEAVDVFIEQIEGLREGGADVAWIETMSAAEEAACAAQSAIAVGLPYVITYSFDTAGRTMMGLLPGAAAGQGVWTAVLDGSGTRPTEGVAVWNGESNTVSICQFEGQDNFDRAFGAHLTVAVIPMKYRRGPAIGEELPALARLIVGVENKVSGLGVDLFA